MTSAVLIIQVFRFHLGGLRQRFSFFPWGDMNKQEDFQDTESHLGTVRGNTWLLLESSPSKWSREVKRQKLGPSDKPGLLDHASPEASIDPALDFTVTGARLSQESF